MEANFSISKPASDRFINTGKKLDDDLSGTLGLYVSDLKNSFHFCLHENELFPTASVFKVFVMVAAFALHEEGEMDFDQVVKNQKRKGDCGGTFSALGINPELSILDHIKLMIMYSDNFSTDLLLEIIGKDQVNQIMKKLGFTKSHFGFNIAEMHYSLAGMDDAAKTSQNDSKVSEILLNTEPDPNHITVTNHPENNVTSPKEMGELLNQMATGQLINPEANKQMLDILRLTPSRENFPRYLPPEIPLAHKAGSFRRMQNDVGLIFFPQQTFVFCSFCRDLPFKMSYLGMDTIGYATKALFEMIQEDNTHRNKETKVEK